MPQRHRYCFVPRCESSSRKTPSKLFFWVPQSEQSKRIWFKVARRPFTPAKSIFFCCEDHFNIKNDVSNYSRLSLMGEKAKLKAGVLPHRFDCQPNRKRKEPLDSEQRKMATDSKESLVQHKVINEALNIKIKIEPAEFLDYENDAQTNDIKSTNLEKEKDVVIKPEIANPVEIDWTKQLILRFIDAYKKKEVLWNIHHKHYKVITKKTQAWDDISHQLGVPVYELKKKISSLLASYRKVRQKCLAPPKSDDSDKPTWFAYDSFSFLHDQYKPRGSLYTEERQEENDEDDDEQEIDQKLNFVQCEYNENIAQEYVNENDYTENTTEDGNLHSGQGTSSYRQNLRRKVKRVKYDDGPLVDDKDQFDAYGEYIARKLRTMDVRTCAFVQRSFSDILFDVDMGNVPMLDKNGEANS